MQGDDDRYELDESNMFQTSFNDSSHFGGKVRDKSVRNSLAESSDLHNVSCATYVQEHVPRSIEHESGSSQAANARVSSALLVDSPRMETVLDQIAKDDEEYKMVGSPLVSAAPRQESLENVDLESKLSIEVSGPRWH